MTEITAWLRNKNVCLFYKLKHKIGKQSALKICNIIDYVLGTKGGLNGYHTSSIRYPVSVRNFELRKEKEKTS